MRARDHMSGSLLGMFLAVAGLSASGPAIAEGHWIYVEAGAADDSVRPYRLGVDVEWAEKDWLPKGEAFDTVGLWEFSYGHWETNHDKPGAVSGLNEVGAKAVFRLRGSGAGWRPYVEWGPGFRLISPTKVEDGKRFSTGFQFDNHLGVGFEFGADRQYDVGARIQHISNGGIKEPNSGINLYLLRLGYRW